MCTCIYLQTRCQCTTKHHQHWWRHYSLRSTSTIDLRSIDANMVFSQLTEHLPIPSALMSMDSKTMLWSDNSVFPANLYFPSWLVGTFQESVLIHKSNYNYKGYICQVGRGKNNARYIWNMVLCNWNWLGGFMHSPKFFCEIKLQLKTEAKKQNTIGILCWSVNSCSGMS